ncbi:ribosome biogenesis factor YjgA [uncultured Rhodoferax sp.]|uniref:ribosome biogenesis factor YjgA n=1 Tax=uncultured Rhodoferax sp. TaxID=223188 RepID=UPI0025F2E31F|nr:ribosome biogenesis factor YjgA [uncultured Rhodoferax sp.]
MSRKLKKGYYVKGQFVAEGSALDLEYKRELKGTDEPTRTDLKKESDALQKLGEDLLTLRAELMAKLELPERLVEGVAEAKRITNFEGKRRQMQFIGKLMRKLEPTKWDEIRAALEEQHMPSAKDTLVLHQAEQWRDRLIADDDAVGQWLNLSPDTDSQQLRALVRQARKDAKPEKPGEAQRHGRAYREIFQLVREALIAHQDAGETPAPDAEDDTD